MATSTNNPAVDTGSVSTEKATVRLYVKLGTSTDKDNNSITVIEKQQVSTASDEMTEVKQPDGTTVKMPKNWAKLEQDGFTAFNENEVVRYFAKSLDAIPIMCPDPAQQLVIWNTGLSSLQSAKTTQIAKALKENTTEPEPLFNGDTIDLRVGVGEDGEYSFNAKPKRTSLTDDEKLYKLLIATGKTDEEAQKIIAFVNATKAQSETAQNEAVTA